MINILLCILFSFLDYDVQPDIRVLVVERPFSSLDIVNPESKTYKIVIEKQDSIYGFHYWVDFKAIFSIQERLLIIEELLKLEGDDRICAFPVQTWGGKFIFKEIPNKYYSIQLEALFLINIIALENEVLRIYSSTPVLEDLKTKEQATISGELIEIAFEQYRNWFERVKEKGLENIRYTPLSYPLLGSGVEWLY